MLLFKINYSYKLKILFIPKQAKKMSKIAKKKKYRKAYIATQKPL